MIQRTDTVVPGVGQEFDEYKSIKWLHFVHFSPHSKSYVWRFFTVDRNKREDIILKLTVEWHYYFSNN